jgi:hypothetical protein
MIRAWKVSSLPYEQLHPLADYDRSIFLYNVGSRIWHVLSSVTDSQTQMNKLDPVKRKAAGHKPRHLTWGLLHSAWKSILVVCLMCVFSAIAELSGSVSIQKLLEYLENDGKGANYRPILWVALLFIGESSTYHS